MKSLIIKKLYFKLLVTVLLLFLVFSPLLSAAQYYADIEIDVTDSGFVTIDGLTNHPDLLIINTQNYTYKTQEKWVLNITKNDIFSDFFFNILLPPGASIYQINTSATTWIEEESNRLTIKGFVQNESLSINVDYQITKTSIKKESQMLYYYINIVFLIIIIIIIFIIISYQKSLNKKRSKDIKYEDNMMGLTERQRKIMNLLIEHDTPLNQITIEKELNIPKAAVSRNIHSLERKGLIEIKKAGMSNLIYIKKP